MAKAVLISIRPEWVEKIARGEKTVEVRKTRPKLDAKEKMKSMVPVVRCRDCASFELKGKYPAGMPEYPEGMPYGYCYHWEYEQGMSPNEVDGNDFCSYGRIREDENGRT